MTHLNPFLRNAIILDAAVSTAAGLAMIAGSSLLAEPLGLPSELLLGAGIACVPFVAMLVLVLRAGAAPASLLTTIIAINIAWSAASLLIAFAPILHPTLLGELFAAAQGAAVLLFAELQILGLRRATRATA